jgi:hypothetical protein
MRAASCSELNNAFVSIFDDNEHYLIWIQVAALLQFFLRTIFRKSRDGFKIQTF